MKEAKIVITLSTYNNQDIIKKCLTSCLEQSYHNLEVVVADDGSNDKTLSIINKLATKYDNLHPLPLPHGERGIARKKSIDKAKDLKADYLFIIDSDMILKDNLLSNCLSYLKDNPRVGALVIPELAYSDYDNFFSKVKVFERQVINNAGSDIGHNSIEAARFWKIDAYHQSGGLNPKQISFEETQPTIRYLEQGGVIKRATFTGVWHNEKKVTLKKLVAKKKFYFSVMDKTINSEENGHLKALQRWYFFRPVLYNKKNLKKYIKHPLLTLGMLYMYLILTFVATKEILASKLK